MTQENKQMTVQEFSLQATFDALCAQRNKAQDDNAQLMAQARVAAAERDAYKDAATTLLAAIDCNDEALGKVEEIRKMLAPTEQA